MIAMGAAENGVKGDRDVAVMLIAVGVEGMVRPMSMIGVRQVDGEDGK